MATASAQGPRPVMWRRERRIQVVNVLAVVVGIAYLLWRVVATGTGVNPVAFWALWAAEAYGVLALSLNAMQGWHVPGPPAPRPATGTPPHVDVLVGTYDETDDVVEATLAGAAAIDYPDVTVHLLDDGRRPTMRQLAHSYGAVYRTRDDNAHAKAGNINAALRTMSTVADDLLLVLDADHVPDPRILNETVGYFDDPAVAVVQTPHEFVNLDSFQHGGHQRDVHEQSLFYRVLMPGRDRHDAAFWCGSAAVLRRRALEEVGGVATETITEDYHTTLKLIERGYVARVHDRALVRGLAPDTLEAFLVQRHRWATGNLATLRTAAGPIRNRALRGVQRVHFLATGLWFLSGLQRLTFWAVLLAALWAGVVPAAIDLRSFAFIWSVHIAVATIAGTLLGRGHLQHRDALRWQVLTAASYTGAVVSSILPSGRRFVVTPKINGTSNAAAVLRHAKLPLAVAAALVLAVVVRLVELVTGRGLLPPLPRIALGVIVVFGIVEFALLTLALVGVVRRRQHRASYRVATSLVADVGGVPAVVTDLSQHGLRLLVDGDVPTVGSPVPVVMRVPDVRGGFAWIQVEVEVRNTASIDDRNRWSVGCRIVGSDATARAAIALYVHVTSFGRARSDSAPETVSGFPVGGLDEGSVTVPARGPDDDAPGEGPRPLARSH